MHVAANKIMSFPPTNTLFQSCFSVLVTLHVHFFQVCRRWQTPPGVPDSLEADLFSSFGIICHLTSELLLTQDSWGLAHSGILDESDCKSLGQESCNLWRSGYSQASPHPAGYQGCFTNQPDGQRRGWIGRLAPMFLLSLKYTGSS